MALTTLPHSLTVITPGTTTDAYGNTTLNYTVGAGGATSSTRRGYVQPVDATEVNQSATREAMVREYRCFDVVGFTGLERVTWSSLTLQVVGPSRRWDTPRGTHHYETMMRLVEG